MGHNCTLRCCQTSCRAMLPTHLRFCKFPPTSLSGGVSANVLHDGISNPASSNVP